MLIDVWDTAGQERYRVFNQVYYRGAQGALIVYDATDHSLDCIKKVKRMVSDLRDYMTEEKPIMIVANQYDKIVGNALELTFSEDIINQSM